MFTRINHTSPRPSVTMQPLESRRLMAADLVVQSITVTDGLHDSTSDLTHATIVVKNVGNTAAPSGGRLRMRLSVDDVWGNGDDLVLNYKTMTSPLAAGQTWTYSTSQRATAQPTGTFRFLAYIDGFEAIPESNEGNNVLASAANSVIYADGVLNEDSVAGTIGNDVIHVGHADGELFVTVNGVTKLRNIDDVVNHLFIDAGAGNDVVTADPTLPVKLAITGSSGKDTIVGGAMNDELSGGTGADRVLGGDGHDFLIGGAQGDRLYGEAGDDLILGAGGIDFLFGGEGTNNLIGGGANDRFFAKGNTGIDTISGNDGDDIAEADATDVLASIETVV